MLLLPLILVYFIDVTLGSSFQNKVQLRGMIDSHVHLWGTGDAPFPYAAGAPLPPAGMEASSDTTALQRQLDRAGVAGALVVQPIHYLFDHTYVAKAVALNSQLKGMALLDPLAGPQYLEALKQQGFVGVRFNPALWPKQQDGAVEIMSGERGARLFAQCGELGLPVGFMCFKGLARHAADIRVLLEGHPKTRVVVDHWGFFLQDGVSDDESWAALLALAAFPQVHVKISASFRNVAPGEDQAVALKSRFLQLVDTFSPSRLLWDSDWPYVSAAPATPTAYSEAAVLVAEWGWGRLGEEDARRVLRGTAEDLFGPWPG